MHTVEQNFDRVQDKLHFLIFTGLPKLTAYWPSWPLVGNRLKCIYMFTNHILYIVKEKFQTHSINYNWNFYVSLEAAVQLGDFTSGLDPAPAPEWAAS